MTTGVYTRKINGAFKYLCIDCNKVHHFGRDVGPALMDMQEVITDEIKIWVIGPMMYFQMCIAVSYH